MQTLADTRRLMLVDEVADLARVSPDTIRRAAASGDLPSLRVGPGGRLLRFRIADVDRWIGTPGHKEPHAAK
jgi:excisionase family DNA binding protein